MECSPGLIRVQNSTQRRSMLITDLYIKCGHGLTQILVDIHVHMYLSFAWNKKILLFVIACLAS